MTDAPPQEAFPHQIVERLRFGDTDMQGHVNNAVFATMFETGRVDFLYDADKDMPPAGAQFVIAEITIRFIAEINYPGDIVVASGVSRIGRTSLGLRQALFVNGQRAATADSAIVLIDLQTRRPMPLSDRARAVVETLSMPQ